MLVWAIQNGGFDASTWYWGALVLLATFTAVWVGVLRGHLRLSRASAIAVGLFAGYVAWSYLSMTWAQYPGIALDGSNRALLYLLHFTLLTCLLPWTRETILGALLLFAGGVGVVGIVLMVRLASGADVTALFFGGRLMCAPTGYINSTAALFTMNTLVCIVLSTRRRLPGPVRGLLGRLRRGLPAAGHDRPEPRLALFTLPIIALVAIVIVPYRLRVAAAAFIPVSRRSSRCAGSCTSIRAGHRSPARPGPSTPPGPPWRCASGPSCSGPCWRGRTACIAGAVWGARSASPSAPRSPSSGSRVCWPADWS